MCALLTNGSAHRQIKEESQHETSTAKEAYDLKRFAPLSYLTFPFGILLWPVTPICLPGSSQKTLITEFSYPRAVYVSTPEDSIASRSQRTGQARFFLFS